VPALRRRRGGDEDDDAAPRAGMPAAVPWALVDLLRDGPAPLVPRVATSERLDVALVLGPGRTSPREAGLPPELLQALAAEGVDVRAVTAEDAEEAAAEEPPPAPPQAEVTEGGALRFSRRSDGAADEAAPGAASRGGGAPSGDAAQSAAAGAGAAAEVPPRGLLTRADVVLAAGWPAAPAVLTAPNVRARAVLAAAEPAPLAELGWAEAAEIPVLGPRWLGGELPAELPAGADAAYAPLPVHRREDLVLVHGEEPFGLLAAAELHRRREDLTFAVSGARPDLELPFPFLGVAPGAEALAHAFASAGVAIAPPVRGWRPAALAMLACGQPVVAPDDAAARAALADGTTARLAAGPLEAADAAEALLADLGDRAERTRAGLAHVSAGWAATAAALAAALRSLA
jgi:hypothetical protein